MRCLSQSMATNMDRIRVHRLFDEMKCDYSMVVPTSTDRARVHDATGIPMRNLVASGVSNGDLYQLTLVRRWMFEHLIDDGQKYLIVNDNVSGLFQVDPIYYEGREKLSEWKDVWSRDDRDAIYRTRCLDPLAKVHELFDKMTEWGTVLAGVGGIENFFFREYKWSYRNLVRGDFFVGRKDGGPIDPGPECPTWDDWFHSLDVLDRYGRVAINRWLTAIKPACEPGGLGPERERGEAKRLAAAWLARRFPHIVRISPTNERALQIRRGKWRR